jgi:Tol biopolymer transport system component
MKKLLLFAFPLIFAGCVVQTVAYQLTSVPEEGGIQFTQFTQEDENVVHPSITKDETTKMLRWYAAPLLAVSPDGEQIAYIAESNSFHNLYIKQIIGGRKKIQRTFNRNIMDMAFSPSGTHIAFTENKSGNSDINIINATEGAAITQLAATGAGELGPIYDPEGKSVFFSAQDGERYYVWNIVLETGLKTQYSEGFTPVLTPDGENLLITRNSKDTGFGEIWMINLKRGTETMILSDPDQGFSSPAISPDGSLIACVGTTLKTDNRPQNLDIFTVKLDGTKLTQLTFHGGHDVSPIWSPDGESIFFLAQRANEKGKFNVWKMNVR